MGSTVYEGATPPPNPQAGWLWWDSNSGDLFVYYENNWVAATSIPNSTYTLPKATTNRLGGVEIGTNISIDGNGKISVDFAGLATETYVTTAIGNIVFPPTDRIISPNTSYATYIDNTGTTYSAGDIIPGTNISNLGSVSQPWKDVYVSKGSIVIADNDINVDGVSISNTAKYIVIDRGGLKVTSSIPGREIFQLDNTGKLLLKSEIPAANDSAAFEVIGSLLGESLPIVNRGVMIHSSGAINVPSRVYIDGVGTQATAPYDSAYAAFIGRYARNTVADPQPAQAGDIIVRFGGNAMADGLGLNTISNVRIDMMATETQSATGRGSRIELWTTPIGSTVPQRSLHVDSAGIDLSEATDINAGITFKDGSLLKYWPSVSGNANKILRTNGTDFFWSSETVPTGQVLFKGNWDASANTPTLSISLPTGVSTGWQYIVSVAGTQNVNGTGAVAYSIGDQLIYNGSTWVRIPAAQAQIQSNWTETNNSLASYIQNKPTLATVATTGAYGDLSGLPSIPAAQLNTDWTAVSGITKILNRPADTAADTANTLVLRDSVGGINAKDFTATQDASISSDHGPFNYGTLGYTDTGIMADFSYNANSYNQVVLQNRNVGNAASTNYIVSNNLGTANTYYGEFGMNSSNFTGSGSLALPNAVYLNSVSSDLVLGGSAIHFVIAGGADSVSINSSGVATFANQITGSISGSANSVRHSLTFAATGGAAAGATFDGSTSKTIDYSTVGAQVAGTYVTSIGSSTLTVAGTSTVPTVNLTTGIATPGTYGSSTLVPVLTIDTYGRVTNITTVANPLGTVTSIATGTNNVNGITLSGGPITSSGTISISGSISGLTNSNLSGTAGITNANLATPTISGIQLGNNLANLTAGTGITFSTGTTYNGSTAITINNSITQYTDALARASLSAGTGISYNNTTGVITNTITQYTDALARAAHSFTAGSGAYNSTTGVITIPTNTNQLTNGANFITLASLSAGTGISYNSSSGVIASTITQYTDALARASLSAGTGISYNSSSGVIASTITQYTDSLARGAISVSGSLSYNSGTGVISYTTPTYTVSTASASGGGALSLSGTTFTFTPASIPNYGVGGNQLVYVTNGAVTLGTTTAAQSIFGLSSGVALASNTRYIYEINTVFEVTTSGPGDPNLSYSLAVSGGAVLAKHAYNVQMNNNGNRTDNSAGITMMSNDITTGFSTAVVVATIKNTYNAAFIRGTIDVTTGGNVNFMITLSKAVSALSIPQLSYVTLVPVGAIGANTQAGTWA